MGRAVWIGVILGLLATPAALAVDVKEVRLWRAPFRGSGVLKERERMLCLPPPVISACFPSSVMYLFSMTALELSVPPRIASRSMHCDVTSFQDELLREQSHDDSLMPHVPDFKGFYWLHNCAHRPQR